MTLRPEHLAVADLPAAFGRFELVGVLGAGGMGRVFEARMRGLGRFSKPVALKVIRGSVADGGPEVREGFEREARLGALLRHPHLVDIYDYGEEDGLPWLAMELLEGGSLFERIERGPLPPASALRVASQIAAGLHHMHVLTQDGRPAPLVHRDLKPANVLLHHGQAKITDYGLARAISGPESETWSDAVAGTPSYMSPEQVHGAPLDGRSDLFSLGAIIFEMLTGCRLLQGESLIQIVMQIVRVEEQLERLEPLDGLVPGMSAVLRRCLRAERSHRWPDVAALGAALEGLSVAAGSTAPSLPPFVLPPTVTAPPFFLPTLELPSRAPRALTTGAAELAGLARLTVVIGAVPDGLAQLLLSAVVLREQLDSKALFKRLVSDGSLTRSGSGWAVAEQVREHAASILLPSERLEAEAMHARWFADLGTDAQLARFDQPDAGAVLAERRPLLPDLLVASRRMFVVRTPSAVAWGGYALIAAGRVMLQVGRAAEAADLAGPWLDRRDLDPALRARLLLMHGDALERTARRRDAVEVLQAAIDLARETGDSGVEADACVSLGFYFIGLDPRRARALVERALLLRSTGDTPVAAASVLGSLALIDRMQGLLMQAAERFKQALAALRGHVSPRAIAVLLLNGWPAFDQLGQRSVARAMADEALALLPSLADPAVRGALLANRAVLRMRDGAIPEAMSTMAEAVKAVGAADPRTEAQYIGGISIMAGLLGDVDRADAFGAQAAAAWAAVGDVRGRAVFDVQMARGRRLSGRLEGNLEAVAECLRSLDGLGDHRGAAEAAVELAWTAQASGVPGAHALAEEALARARRQSVFLTCSALLVLARVERQDRRWPEAAATARLGRGLARRHEHLLFAARLDAESARVASATGDQAEADRLRRRALRTIEELGMPEGSPLVREVRSA